MARAKRHRTKHDGVHYRDLPGGRLYDIDVERIERFRDKLTANGLSNDTVRRIITTLGYTLKLARKWRLIAHNPVSDADKPATRRRQPTLPSLQDVERLAKAMPNRETS